MVTERFRDVPVLTCYCRGKVNTAHILHDNTDIYEKVEKDMRKKLFLIGGGSITLLLCILIGAFFAGPLLASAQSTQNAQSVAQSANTPTASNTCQQYLQDLAQRLNVSVTTFEQDRVAAKADVMDQLVKDGKLTQAQADAIKQQMASKQICSGKGHSLGVERSILHQALVKYRSTLLNQVAQGLHLSTTKLQSDLQAGQSLEKIAKTQGVSASQLHTIALNAAQTALNQAQQAGVITQSQNTSFAKYLKNHPRVINAWLRHDFVKKHVK
jgi:hypothetical protein